MLRQEVKVGYKIYFPHLDGLRFFAFLYVFLFHSFSTEFTYIKNNSIYKFVDYLFREGELGVNFFFVLSGFLISYLLYIEKIDKGEINIKNFYIRRALRIWPLYFVVVIVGFYLFPILKSLLGGTPNENASISYYLLFLSNLDIVRKHDVPDSSILSVLWSVAIEEQFYFVWPLILTFFRFHLYPYIFCIIIALCLYFRSTVYSDYIYLYFHTLSVVMDMAVGALCAWVCYSNKKFLSIIEHLPKGTITTMYFFIIILILARRLIFINPTLIIFERLIYSLFFAFIILEQNYSLNSFYKMGNFKLISRIGQYTYGLYILQFIGILSATTISKMLGTNKTVFGVLVGETFSAFIICLILSYISFHYYESFFLRLKNQFSVFRKDN